MGPFDAVHALTRFRDSVRVDVRFPAVTGGELGNHSKRSMRSAGGEKSSPNGMIGVYREKAGLISARARIFQEPLDFG